MTLKSIAEDLQARTLRSVAGLLGKLGYLAGLRQGDGTYQHWGLARVHGEAATQRALMDAHRGVVSKILRTPLHELLEDVDDSSESKETAKAELLEKLNAQPAQLVPPSPGAGAVRHLSSVLHALSSLVKSRS